MNKLDLHVYRTLFIMVQFLAMATTKCLTFIVYRHILVELALAFDKGARSAPCSLTVRAVAKTLKSETAQELLLCHILSELRKQCSRVRTDYPLDILIPRCTPLSLMLARLSDSYNPRGFHVLSFTAFCFAWATKNALFFSPKKL